jgi:hypothetical protein
MPSIEPIRFGSLVRQWTQAINAVRGHLAKLGIVAAKELARSATNLPSS